VKVDGADLIDLPADGMAAGLARRVVRDRLRDWDREDLLDDAVLLASEVVTNVLLHTVNAPALGVTREGAGIRVTVADGSSTPPRHRPHAAGATTGRGMELLQDLADDWGWNFVPGGKVVWFVVGNGHAAGRHPAGPVTESVASPMGRYAGAADGTGTTVRVELLGVPVRVLAAAREHHDSVMREFRLLALAGPPDGREVPARLVELTRELGVRYSAARARPDAEVDRALEQGLDTIDLVYQVAPTVVDGARTLETLMAEADEFCRSAQLITLPRTPSIIRFSTWYLGQFVDQVAGRPATRWNGPLDP
jgi:anti-sigma regulatory factor (Ser/Thr protein kinase)